MKLVFGKKGSYPAPLKVTSKDKTFIWTLLIGFIVSMVVVPYPSIAMWVGFIFAGYAAIANDSIQTIGTFIASNSDKKMVLVVVIFGFYLCSYSRL